MTRGELRIARTTGHLEALRRETRAWFDARRDEPALARFGAHFDLLQPFLERLLGAVEGRLDELARRPDPGAGATYDRCRAAELSLNVVRRTFNWYASKYDQRARRDEAAPAERDEAVSASAATLLAADEVVRSCWSEPFAALGRTAPSGPLAYLEPRFDAFATPRESVPPDLRAPGDELIGQMVRALPIPTIALPVSCPEEPWWLVVAAHETGHHVQKDLRPGLEEATRESLERAVSPLPGGQERAADWRRWALECFADAFSVLMVGPVATWAVDELQHTTVEGLLRPTTGADRYPPPIVRLALLGEIERCLGLPGPIVGRDEALAWLRGLDDDPSTAAARDEAEQQLGLTPAAAAALVDLPIEAGQTLRQVCGWRGDHFADQGLAATWAAQLVRDRPLIAPRDRRWAARVAIGGVVGALRRALVDGQAGDQAEARLRRNLIAVLRSCGEPGVLAAAGPAVDTAPLADRFAALLPDATDGRH